MTPVRRTRHRKSQKHAGPLGLLCAEQNVVHLKKSTFRIYGTSARRTKRRKSQKMHVQEIWASCVQNKTGKSQDMHFQNFRYSCAQSKTSEISRHVHFQEFWDSCARDKTSEISTNAVSVFFHCVYLLAQAEILLCPRCRGAGVILLLAGAT